jgi:AraC family transcriptional regulator
VVRGAKGSLRNTFICLPYKGHFVCHMRHDDVVADANQILFVPPAEEYRMSSPLPEGHAELIIWPDARVLADLADETGSMAANPLFRRGTRRASVRLQTARARFLYWVRCATPVDQLEADELLVDILGSALQHSEPPETRCSSHTRRLLGRAKEFLEAELASSIQLKNVGQAVGASPTYLTDVFRRVEGVSLHQYLTRLRLARALVELPDADDLTTLAFDIGFSSHSHFTAAFRQRFGRTPWESRRALRSFAKPRSQAQH